METNATLAVVLLDAGKTDQALATAEPLLPKLTSSALQGAEAVLRPVELLPRAGHRWGCAGR
jgi:hypothetical protein